MLFAARASSADANSRIITILLLLVVLLLVDITVRCLARLCALRGTKVGTFHHCAAVPTALLQAKACLISALICWKRCRGPPCVAQLLYRREDQSLFQATDWPAQHALEARRLCTLMRVQLGFAFGAPLPPRHAMQALG